MTQINVVSVRSNQPIKATSTRLDYILDQMLINQMVVVGDILLVTSGPDSGAHVYEFDNPSTYGKPIDYVDGNGVLRFLLDKAYEGKAVHILPRTSVDFP